MSEIGLELDQRMMGRALRVASNGRPSPNPHVGAVLVRRAKVLATGYHRRAGEAHAEVAALDKAGRRARGATLYVTFEPCNHWGRTGPCTEAIINSGVARVVIGCRDPAPHVPGAVRRLRRAGIEVTVGVRKQEAQRLIADFTKHFTSGIPYVTVKAAVTLDGRTATRGGDSKWITGEAARRHAHRMRDRSDAVMVGVGTVLADDPSLTVRHVRGRDPLRAVVDGRLRTPPSAKVLRGGETILYHGPRVGRARRRALLAAGAELVEVRTSGAGLDLRSVLEDLGNRDVVRLLVEGGPRLHGALLGAGLADRAAVFVAPRILGDPEALPLAFGPPKEHMAGAWQLTDARIQSIGEDVLFVGELARTRGRRGR